MQPAQWLLTEDGSSPEPCWNIPEAFQKNLVMLWAVRADCLHLALFPHVTSDGPGVDVNQTGRISASDDFGADAADSTETSAPDAFLQMLKAQRGVSSDTTE